MPRWVLSACQWVFSASCSDALINGHQFHQIIRAATPFFTTLFSWCLFNVRFNRYQISSIGIVVVGVGLSTCGDYHFTTWGFILTLVGTVLAALKTIMTHIVQTAPFPAQSNEERPKTYCINIPSGPVTICSTFLSRFRRRRLKLHPLDLLTHLSRLALVQCIAYAYFFGELSLVLERSSYPGVLWQIILISGNGIVACALNIVSFEANRRSGALSMGVAGYSSLTISLRCCTDHMFFWLANVKQILTVLCAVWFFHLNLTLLNVLGIMLTLLGGGLYTVIEYYAKHGYPRS